MYTLWKDLSGRWLIWGMAMIIWSSWNKNEVAMRGCSWTWNSVVSPEVSPGHLEWSYWSGRLSLVYRVGLG